MPVVDVAAENEPGPSAARAAPSTSIASTSAATAALEALMVADNPVAELKDLKQKAAELRKEKQELNRALRNAQRRNKRLKEKAKQLSDADLLSVMLTRRDKKARLDELAGAQAAAASAAAGAAGPADVEVVAPGASSERPQEHMQGEAGGRP